MLKAIMKREIRNYLNRPVFWIGVLIIILGVYQNLKPYLGIHYIASESEVRELVQDYPDTVPDADVSDGYVPAKEKERRSIWEGKIQETLISELQMEQSEAEAVIKEMKEMDVKEASAYLEETYSFYNALNVYEHAKYHQGTKEEINSYIRDKLEHKRFSYYFSRKFADFAGLFMGFFSVVMLAALFWQDTRRNTYELLHTKSVSAGRYVSGKIAGGFSVCVIVLAILSVIFWILCCIFTKSSGFEVKLIDFIAAAVVYILPNMLMIVCVYALISLLFQNPLPAAPLLILYMVYSNMGSRNANGIYGYYGRPLAIMVRFPGQFFDTAPPPMIILNQSFLLLASCGILFLCIQLWKRRRI